MSQVHLPLHGREAVVSGALAGALVGDPAGSQAGAEASSGAAGGARRALGRLAPLGPALAVVYITLAATLLVDPQPVLDRLDDLDPSPVVSAARSVVGAVAAASGALGLSTLSAAVRGRTAPLFKRSEARP